MKNLLWVLLVWSNALFAQHGALVVKSGMHGLYLDHTVVAREGFFSIGRIYTVHPKFLADFNGLDINKGLNIGQVIHIPLTDTNFTQKKKTSTPVYYVVGEKEGLLKVSNLHNKVKLQSLREWNKLSNDNIQAGSKLVVGYLLHEVPVQAPPVVKEEPKPAAPVVKKEEPSAPVVVKEEPKKTEPAPVTEVVKDAPKKELPKTDSPSVKQPAVTNGSAGQGYFKSHFEEQVKQNPATKSETVTAGIFNTTNGLQDAKYYLLIDKVTPGTIIRVTNPENNRVIYAKVLGEMNGYRQNQGLDIRLSNLAASTLGIRETDKFIVKLSY